jgi:hypothetical protein
MLLVSLYSSLVLVFICCRYKLIVHKVNQSRPTMLKYTFIYYFSWMSLNRVLHGIETCFNWQL